MMFSTGTEIKAEREWVIRFQHARRILTARKKTHPFLCWLIAHRGALPTRLSRLHKEEARARTETNADERSVHCSHVI